MSAPGGEIDGNGPSTFPCQGGGVDVLEPALKPFAFLVGCVLVAAAAAQGRRWLRLLRAGVRASGEVVGHVPWKGAGPQSVTTYRPRVRFAGPGHLPREFTSAFGSRRRRAVGSLVAVLFDPARPDNAEIAAPWLMLAGPLALAAIGLTAIAGAFGLAR